MEERQSFSDGELLHALRRHMDGTREVEPALTEELVRRGYVTGPPGPPDVTAWGRDLLGMDAPLDEDIKAVVLASQQSCTAPTPQSFDTSSRSESSGTLPTAVGSW